MKREIDILTTDECHSLLSACSKAPTGIRNRAMVVVLWRACLGIKEGSVETLFFLINEHYLMPLNNWEAFPGYFARLRHRL